MSTINFDELYQELKNGVETVAKETLRDYTKEAKLDGEQALAGMKNQLQHWTQEVENGAMTREDLAFLLQGEEGLSEMLALKQAGLAAVHIDEFRNNLVSMIMGTLTAVIKV